MVVKTMIDEGKMLGSGAPSPDLLSSVRSGAWTTLCPAARKEYGPNNPVARQRVGPPWTRLRNRGSHDLERHVLPMSAAVSKYPEDASSFQTSNL